MISVDTNVILSALERSDSNHEQARLSLQTANASDVLVISPIVYAELTASPNREGVLTFLERAGIRVLWDLPPEVWDTSGRASGAYAKQRRGGVPPRRILADVVIAAHAEHHKLAVLTFDGTIYRAVFPGLKVSG